MIEKVVVLADGQFPQADLPLAYLNEAERIICCDGAVQNLVNHGLEPSAIVGDMDSIPAKLMSRYKSILNPDKDQNTNDLTKAIKYCLTKGIEVITILGAILELPTGYLSDKLGWKKSLLISEVFEIFLSFFI